MSIPQIIWANKPGCANVVAELWIGERDLLLTVFLDDADKTIKVEVLPNAFGSETHVISFAELEHLLSKAKRELCALARPSPEVSQ